MKPQVEFAYIWEYRVKKDEVDAFRRVYGPTGNWVELFRRDDAYLRTELFQDADDSRRFVTTDFWTSKTARDTFRQRFKNEFDELDRRCEILTEEERFLGDFHRVMS
jgi:quinol monooxygenase YgiN